MEDLKGLQQQYLIVLRFAAECRLGIFEMIRAGVVYQLSDVVAREVKLLELAHVLEGEPRKRLKSVVRQVQLL